MSNNDFPTFYLFSHELFIVNRGLVCTRSCDFQVSPILIHSPDVNINGAPRCCRLVFPHRCGIISGFLLSLQTELKTNLRCERYYRPSLSQARALRKTLNPPKSNTKVSLHYLSLFGSLYQGCLYFPTRQSVDKSSYA